MRSLLYKSHWIFHKVAPKSQSGSTLPKATNTFLTDHGQLRVVANKIICYRRLTNPFALILINESVPASPQQLGPET